MTSWRAFLQTLARNPISLFAVLCVAAIGGFLGYMAMGLTDTLASPDWCGKALQAQRITAGNTFVGLTACVDLLKIQLQATADNSKIVFSAFAFSLLVLIVIVVAGAKASGKLPGDIEFDVSRDVTEAADKVADAAVNKASQIKGTTNG